MTDLGALEEQRDFLLRSLDDLERERTAGDVDEHDYEALKDDYTARAAAVLRAIDAKRSPVATSAPRQPWGRTLAWVAGVVAFAAVAGVLVAQSAGRRDPGDVATGDIRQTIAERLNGAFTLLAERDFEGAIAGYDDVLEDEPTNAEALTYKAWALWLSDQQEEGFTAMLQAATAASDYPDAHAFLAVMFFRQGLVAEAARELDLLEDLDPPPHIQELIEPLAEEIDAALDDQGQPGGGR